jgi:hypothetical protein
MTAVIRFVDGLVVVSIEVKEWGEDRRGRQRMLAAPVSSAFLDLRQSEDVGPAVAVSDLDFLAFNVLERTPHR